MGRIASLISKTLVSVMLLTLLGHNLNPPPPVPRAPLYVTAKTVPVPAAPDIYPNIAVKFQTQRPAGTYIDPVRYNPVPPAPDVYPNIAVNLQTIQPAGRYLDPQFTLKVPALLDVYPNLAVNLQTIRTWPGLDPVIWRTRPTQVDQYFNLALAQPPAGALPPVPIEPQFSPKWAAAADVYPNIAVAFTNVYVTRTPFYTITWRSPPPQIDVLPNIAAFPVPALGIVTTFDDLPRYRDTRFDLYPNLAVTAPVTVIIPPLDVPPRRTPWPAIEIYPNLAAKTEVVPFIHAAQPFDFHMTIRWTVPPDIFPNIAAVTSTPVVVVGLHEIGLGFNLMRLGGRVGAN